MGLNRIVDEALHTIAVVVACLQLVWALWKRNDCLVLPARSQPAFSLLPWHKSACFLIDGRPLVSYGVMRAGQAREWAK